MQYDPNIENRLYSDLPILVGYQFLFINFIQCLFFWSYYAGNVFALPKMWFLTNKTEIFRFWVLFFCEHTLW